LAVSFWYEARGARAVVFGQDQHTLQAITVENRTRGKRRRAGEQGLTNNINFAREPWLPNAEKAAESLS
jgi:hypothetical protein